MVAPHAETRFFEHEILGLELLSKVRMFFLQQDPKTGAVASQTANCSGPLDPINKDCVEVRRAKAAIHQRDERLGPNRGLFQ